MVVVAAVVAPYWAAANLLSTKYQVFRESAVFQLNGCLALESVSPSEGACSSYCCQCERTDVVAVLCSMPRPVDIPSGQDPELMLAPVTSLYRRDAERRRYQVVRLTEHFQRVYGDIASAKLNTNNSLLP